MNSVAKSARWSAPSPAKRDRVVPNRPGPTVSGQRTSRTVMKKSSRFIGPAIIVALTLAAIALLIRELQKHRLADIHVSLAQIPWPSLWLSFALMILNYLILVGYDGLALRAIRKRLSLARTMLVSFVGCVISYNFGALLGGSSARFRFYSLWGFSLGDMLRLVTMLALTFWVGAFGLAGILFLLQPIPLPDAFHLPVANIHVLGVLLLLCAAGYLALCLFWHKPLRFRGKSLRIPSFGIAVAQMLVAWADLVVASACLFVLMPEDLGIGFAQFLTIYLLAMVVVVVTHVPGGTGVFELVILSASNTSQPQAVIAALLCFRIIYFLIPLFFVAVIFLVHEIQIRRSRKRREPASPVPVPASRK